MVDKLNISVEAIGAKPVNIKVEIDLTLSSKMKDFDAEAIVNDAVNEGRVVSENYLRKLK